MTIAQAIAQSSALKPGLFSDSDKTAWLSQLDGQIDAEIIRTHEGAPETAFAPYTQETDPGTQLLIPDPYSKLYVSYLCAQMDFYSAEYARFNNTQRRFELDFREAADWYNRTRLPLKQSGIHLGETEPQRPEGAVL